MAGGQESQLIESMAEQFVLTKTGMTHFTQWTDPELKFYSFDRGKADTVSRISGTVNYGLSVSPDERWVLYSRMEHPGSDLMLLENFR